MHIRAFAVAALATLSSLSLPASAADLGWGGASPTTGMLAPSSAFNWSGFYLGVNGGYGWGAVRETPPGLGTTETNAGGWFAGAQGGYNFDFGGFVLGGELDLGWTNIGYQRDVAGGGTARANLDMFGTARLRAGASFGQVMPYFTGGLAGGRGSVSSTTAGGVVTTQSDNHFGWTLGGGLEAAATDNITLRAEYLYVDLGDATYTTGGNSDFGHRFGVLRAGINYKF